MLAGKPLPRFFKEFFEAWNFAIYVAGNVEKLNQSYPNYGNTRNEPANRLK